jgi:hypothetical protein
MPKYMYIPGLARSECLSLQGDFADKLAGVFGADPFITGAVKALDSQRVEAIDCGTALTWVDVAKAGKALKTMGGVTQNMLTRRVGTSVTAPRRVGIAEMPDYESPWCTVNTYLAQPGSSRMQSHRTLSRISASGTLHLIGHGNPDGGSLGFRTATSGRCKAADCRKKHRDFWVVDPVTLATLLEADGLPKTHQEIYMVQCFGAGLSNDRYQTVQPYAERLATALNERGYKRLSVAGVAGVVFGNNLTVGHKIDEASTEFDERIMVRVGGRTTDAFTFCLKFYGRGAPQQGRRR